MKVENKIKAKKRKILMYNKIALNLYVCKKNIFAVIVKSLIYTKKTFNENITKKKIYTIMKENGIFYRLRIKKNKILL
ncbi:conserved hypothetical protein [Aster yellows witches'-broom phytoplasma AYWB]|uniref:Uncharacterized protein n=1 Tax=Aster yellows witches'-broom phytoplasma (strain AYWB) TaxID=322098 RepID=Q2NJH6_AYWBP|nr:conserved hypothetical protein [Aster yellows witches'-broom phytoplasma AYWB]